MSKGRLRRG